MSRTFIYLSNWKHFAEDEGLALYEFNNETGEMTYIDMAAHVSCNVTQYDKKRGLLYVSEETEKLPWTKVGGGGRMLVYDIDKVNGNLTLVNEQLAFATNPCQFTQDPTGQYLILANHASHASITKVVRDTKGKYGHIQLWDDAPLVLYPLNEKGHIGEPLDVVLTAGDGPHPHQQHPMLHSAEYAPGGEFFVVSDLGSDKIFTFKIDYERKVLVQKDIFNDIPGSTPRYIKFHPTLPYFYVNHEGGSMEVLRMKYDKNGSIEPVDRVWTVDDVENIKVLNDQQQAMIMDPTGHYIYDVLRGQQNEIAVFSIDQESGALTRIQNQPLKGQWARGCTLSPDGRFLITMCMMSGEVEVFAVGEDGRLIHTGHTYSQPGCSWATFVEV